MSKSDKSKSVKIMVSGKERMFDVDDPKLPDWAGDKAMESGGYPYEDKLDRKEYEETLERLQGCWSRTFASIESLEREIGFPLQEVLARAIAALEERDFAERLLAEGEDPAGRGA